MLVGFIQFCRNEPKTSICIFFFLKGEQMAKEMSDPCPAPTCLEQPIKHALALQGFSKAVDYA